MDFKPAVNTRSHSRQGGNPDDNSFVKDALCDDDTGSHDNDEIGVDPDQERIRCLEERVEQLSDQIRYLSRMVLLLEHDRAARSIEESQTVLDHFANWIRGILRIPLSSQH